MAGASIILSIDVPSRRFVVSNGSLDSFASIQIGQYQARIYLRTMDENTLPGFLSSSTKEFDRTGYDGIRVGLWSAHPGTDETLLTVTDQTGWTYDNSDPDNPYWQGTIDTTTEAIRTWIADSACKSCFLGISLVRGTDITPILDLPACGVANFEIKNKLDPGTGQSTDTTGATARLPLAFQFGPDSNGKIYSVDGVSGGPPVLNISCINPGSNIVYTVTPYIFAATPISYFGGGVGISFPPGNYKVRYLYGALEYHSGTGWRVNLFGGSNSRFIIIHSGGTEIDFPGVSGSYASQALCEAANSGAEVSFTHSGGTIAMYLHDVPYNDNVPGDPTPTFQLISA